MGELGSWLIRAREARGLTLEDAERDTRISRRYLQALEFEQFDVIPAPVYARGFLRSYSQYLGLDPQRTLALFPHEEGAPYAATAPSRRPTVQQPPSAVGPPRPVWRNAGQGQQSPQEASRARAAQREKPKKGRDRGAAADEPVIGAGGRMPQVRPPGKPPSATPGRPATMPSPPPRSLPSRNAPAATRGAAARPLPADPDEITIGIDIGVPVPARRLEQSTSSTGRSAGLIVIAILAVLAIIAVAFLISRLGDDEGGSPDETDGAGGSTTLIGRDTPTSVANRSGLPIEPGIAPNVIGQPSTIAILAIQEAGFVPDQRFAKHATAPRGTVFDQGPAPGVPRQTEGDRIVIYVSEGP